MLSGHDFPGECRLSKTIGIIGANGQLGTEVCLFLSQMDQVKLIPICRNRVGATFLRRCGLNVRIGTLDNEEKSRKLLEGLDLIADFSLPVGSTSYVRRQICHTISSLVRFAPTGAPFVYLSSILAFGNPDFHSDLKDYKFSRTAYGTTKRYAEGLVRKVSRGCDRPSYLFRVGVVHGELQASTRQLIKDTRVSAHLTAYLPDCESYTVFAFTIAEALVSAAHQRDRPGLYTLVSNPAWSWNDLHRYVCDRAGVYQSAVLLQPHNVSSTGVVRLLEQSIFGILKRQKEVVNGCIAAVLPNLEQRMRATYHMRNAEAEINRDMAEARFMPYLDNFSIYPGRRLQGISDSRTSMLGPARKLRETMLSVLPE